MSKISVVVPVYNADKYLKDCIDSLLAQTINDFEIILVNDGSTDNSKDICHSFANKYSNIYVIDKVNGGAASARNIGIKKVKGDYIAFVDADDTVLPTFLEDLYNAAVESNADIAMCDYTKFTKNGSFPFSQPIRGGYYSKAQIEQELYKCLIMYDNLEFPPTISNCVCLFKRSLLIDNRIEYPLVRLCEDSFFGSVCLYNANGFVYIKGKHLYNYNYTPSSVSHSVDKNKTKARWQSFLSLNKEYQEYFKNTNYDFSLQIKYNMLYFALNQLSYIKGCNLSFSELKKGVSLIFNDEQVKAAFNKFKYPKVSFKLKVIIFFIKHRLPFLYCLICR